MDVDVVWNDRAPRWWRSRWLIPGALLALAATVYLTPSFPQTVDSGTQELLRQQARERALREQQKSTPDVRLPRATPTPTDRLPTDETPCFLIQSLRLVGDDASHFERVRTVANPHADPGIGRCLGTTGVNAVMRRVQNAIVARGYVTTRVLAKPQDLHSGVLTLTVVPCRIHSILVAPGVDTRAVSWRDALPARPGDLLNLRDIEQALENLKPVPTVDADIQIVPAEGHDAQAGESDMVILWKQSSPMRLALTLDDSGSDAIGRLQGGASLSLDSLLTWNDLFYVNAGQSVLDGDRKGTRNTTVHYEFPCGNWSLGATASDYT